MNSAIWLCQDLDALVEKRLGSFFDLVTGKLAEAQRQISVWKALAIDLQEQAKEAKGKSSSKRNVGIQVDIKVITGLVLVPPCGTLDTRVTAVAGL